MRIRTTRRPGPAVLATLGGVTALALAGCGADTTDVAGEDTAQACEDLVAYSAALEDLADSLGSGAASEEVMSAHEQAGEAQTTLHASISDVAEERTDDVGRAWDELVSSFDSAVEGDAELGESASDLRAQAQAVLDHAAAVHEDLDC